VLRPRVGAHTTAAMPWQTAPGLVIITVAFAAGGYLIGGTNYLFTGRFVSAGVGVRVFGGRRRGGKLAPCSGCFMPIPCFIANPAAPSLLSSSAAPSIEHGQLGLGARAPRQQD